MADTTSSLDPKILPANLDALSEAFPRTFEQLNTVRASLPVAHAAPTRDGRINLRVSGPDGTETWFGRTSIPQVRARSLVDGFQAGQANVLLPGIAEGSEAQLLLARLGPHRAVFVWAEPAHADGNATADLRRRPGPAFCP